LDTINQIIPLEFSDVSLYIKREDLIHPFVSGNKFRKLKYNLLAAEREGYKTILTFGGAFSNHIAAVSAAAKECGFESIGIIRGDELDHKINENPTLLFAKNCGMTFEFISRESYRLKNSPEYLDELQKKFDSCYIIPEGGTNTLAVKGCEEILTTNDTVFDYICCPVGTGGTISGLINSIAPHQQVLGFPALKGGFLREEICKFAKNDNWKLINDYHFGGYAKINNDLIAFINQFRKERGILLDPIYTAKMVFGVLDMINNGYFPKGSKILAIHTGGIQGIAGMNLSLANKKLPLIQTHD
jgi:1-aminocyclopropane-1-carboxylate deaminase